MKVAILTNIVPKYRKGFYKILFENKEHEFHVYCQNEIPGGNYETIHHLYKNRIHEVSFISTKSQSLCWQFFPAIFIYKNYDIVFIDGNPRIISQALFASILQVLNKKIVLWSMLHSHNNNKLTENIRLRWMRMFKYHFLYNDNEYNILKNTKGFEKAIIGAMNNGLDQSLINSVSEKWTAENLNKWRIENFNRSREFDIVTFGRITPGKYDVLVELILKLKEEIKDFFCCIIGDGQSRFILEKEIKNNNLQNYVHFTGAIHEDEKLAPYLLSSKVLIHPTAVGLSIMHCFGYGVPIITHNKIELHGPEFVAFINNVNGLSYKHNDNNDLFEKTMYLLNNEELRLSFSKNAKKLVQEKYNTSVMADRIINMVVQVTNDQR